MKSLLVLGVGLLLLASGPTASAADYSLLTVWQPITQDDAGNDLAPGSLSEYRVYDCSGVLVAAVPASETQLTEPGAVVDPTSGDSFCRRVVGYAIPFESAPAEATAVVVRPGSTTVTTTIVP